MPEVASTMGAPMLEGGPTRQAAIPVFFTEAQGHPGCFWALGSRWAFLCTPTGIVVHLCPGLPDEGRGTRVRRRTRRSLSLRVSFVSPHPHGMLLGEEVQPARANWIHGRHPKGWRLGLPTYQAVRYRDLWPGVDLTIRCTPRIQLTWHLQPGVSPEGIRLRVEGAQSLGVEADGTLSVDTPLGQVRLQAPQAYQSEGDGPSPCRVAYRLFSEGKKDLPTVGFTVPEPYDPSLPLIIDPALLVGYATYLGGSGYDAASGVAADAQGNAYVVGSTVSPNFPVTPGAFQGTPGGLQDVFVAKLDPSGHLLFATYLGGSGDDTGHGVAVDAQGQIYVTGVTSSANFPLRHPVQASRNGRADAFASALDPTGSQLLFSTYLGGSSVDIGYAVAVDDELAVYVAGSTDSADFPVTPGAFQTVYRGQTDAFVAKLAPGGSSLVYATYLGGTSGEEAMGVAVGPEGSAYVTGYTFSSNFPVTPGALQSSLHGLYDAFFARLSPNGSQLLAGTHLGGSDTTFGAGVAVGPSGEAFVAGYTTSADFPVTAGAWQTTFGGVADGFVAQLSPLGDGLVYSTYLGGSGTDSALAIAVDGQGRAYVTGETNSPNFPRIHAFQPVYGGGLRDAYVAMLEPSGQQLGFSSYLGGSDYDYGTGIALDPAGRIYVVGVTYSADLPVTAGAAQVGYGGAGDAFLAQVLPLGTSIQGRLVSVSATEVSRLPLPVAPPGIAQVTLDISLTFNLMFISPAGASLGQKLTSVHVLRTVVLQAPEGSSVRVELVGTPLVEIILPADPSALLSTSLCLLVSSTIATYLLVPSLGLCPAVPCPPSPPAPAPKEPWPACILTTAVLDSCLLQIAIQSPLPLGPSV